METIKNKTQDDAEKLAELKYLISKGGSAWMPTADDCNKANKQEGFIAGYNQAKSETPFSEAQVRKLMLESFKTDNLSEYAEKGCENLNDIITHLIKQFA